MPRPTPPRRPRRPGAVILVETQPRRRPNLLLAALFLTAGLLLAH